MLAEWLYLTTYYDLIIRYFTAKNELFYYIVLFGELTRVQCTKTRHFYRMFPTQELRKYPKIIKKIKFYTCICTTVVDMFSGVKCDTDHFNVM